MKYNLSLILLTLFLSSCGSNATNNEANYQVDNRKITTKLKASKDGVDVLLDNVIIATVYVNPTGYDVHLYSEQRQAFEIAFNKGHFDPSKVIRFVDLPDKDLLVFYDAVGNIDHIYTSPLPPVPVK